MIAIDAMGGDFAPDAVLDGALRYAREKTGQPICLFGPKDDLVRRLIDLDPSWENYSITISDVPEVIAMGDDPVASVREKKDSSLVRAVAAVADGSCSAVISAGNSGAMVAASIFLIGRKQGVERPALVGLLPGTSGPVVSLDLGANADCKPSYLLQFAQLGVAHAGEVLECQNPRVGLLSVGEEDAKGSLLTKKAFKLLRDSKLNFVGNVEPHHVFNNQVDVVVCDGFLGNVLLKTLEAVGALCCAFVEKKDAAYAQELRKLLHRYESGGALLLGLKKPAFVVHGGASADGVKRAIEYAQGIVF